MNTTLSRITAIATGVMFLMIGGGCHKHENVGTHPHTDEHHSHAAHAEAWHFDERRGVQLLPESIHRLGIEVSDVSHTETVEGGKVTTSMTIPSTALLHTVRGNFVYVLSDGYFFRSPVEVGIRSEDQVAIADGLFDGDAVVSSGVKALWLIELQALNSGAACADDH